MDLSEEALEEVQAIRSIYPEWVDEETDLGTLVLRLPVAEAEEGPHGSLHLEMRVCLPPEYPASTCPLFELSGSALDFLSRTQVDALENDLLACYAGSVCCFEMIELARSALKDVFAAGVQPAAKVAASVPAARAPSSGDAAPLAEATRHKLSLPWAITEPVNVQKSTFVGYATSVRSEGDVERAMEDLMGDKAVARATHRILAYRIVSDGRVREDRDDDGEVGAARFLAFLLSQSRCENVLVVVVRWYGGVHLGPLRFRLIQTCGRDALERHGAIPKKQ
ncbi:ribosomal protein S5 domain 2-type protein [Hyaloraphidium curvatum]|nr:ribosomal protein S5 domain 2-type protein [Hyaloraphidium curvatum]